uniref:Fibronectin type-III domain-containing protein n=1 Tax=Eptatretus burgeri TaxID=7764 RepID=A0A8C4R3D3_EPTBU
MATSSAMRLLGSADPGNLAKSVTADPEGSSRRRRRLMRHSSAEVAPAQQPALATLRGTKPAPLIKSYSVDAGLGVRSVPDTTRGQKERGRSTLKRKASLGSFDRKDSQLKRFEGSLARLTQRLNQRERSAGEEDGSTTSLSATNDSSRQRSISFDWSCASRMSQQVRGSPGRGRMSSTGSMGGGGPASPSAAKRLYRNLSGKFRSSSSSLEDNLPVSHGDRQRKSSTNISSSEALFEAVELQDLEMVQLLLSRHSAEDLDFNTPNSEGLTPLDVAIMTNNLPLARALLNAGARESPHFMTTEGRACHLEALASEAARRATEMAAVHAGSESGSPEEDTERQLHTWEWRLRLLRRMQAGFQHAGPPEVPTNVCLSVVGSSTLSASYEEPMSMNSAMVTKYKVQWSCYKSFKPLTGEAILDDCRVKSFSIQGLTPGTAYFVRVSAYNMKGWGLPQASAPCSAIPSSWWQSEGCMLRPGGQEEAFDTLLLQLKNAQKQWRGQDMIKVQGPSRKPSVSRSLRHLFQSTSKFVKNLKRALYLATVFYQGDNILVTHEEQIPIVEIDDSFSTSLMQDFLWFCKLSCMWSEAREVRQATALPFSASSALQARQKLLLAVSHMQHLLGTQDLGQPYLEPLKDRQGNGLFVTLRYADSVNSSLNLRWLPASKLQSQRKSLSGLEDPTALDVLLITLQEKIDFQKAQQQVLAPGLYLGFLKLCSSVDQIKILVPQTLPNVLCHTKVRDNGHLSREEWETLGRVGSLEQVFGATEGDVHTTESIFLREIHVAVLSLLHQLHVPLEQAADFRLHTQDLVEFGNGISFLLLLPPSDDVCVAPGQGSTFKPVSGLVSLPLQVFELVLTATIFIADSDHVPQQGVNSAGKFSRGCPLQRRTHPAGIPFEGCVGSRHHRAIH